MLFQYASVEKNNEHYMTAQDFIQRFLGLLLDKNYDKHTLHLLANCVDTTKDGQVLNAECSFAEILEKKNQNFFIQLNVP